MDIHTAETWQIQSGARQDQAVGDDHEDVGLPSAQIGPIRICLQRSGLRDGHPVLQRCELYGACS
jgi:hypothetical protein